MIARHEAHMDRTNIWSALAAPVPAGAIAWRQDGRAVERDGRYFARFVAYIEANTVRERLDSVVPGEWDLTLELLPPLPAMEEGEGGVYSFKARLQILGVIREDVGTGRDYKQAATDAFKRAAVRFGVAHELYGYEQNWVELDGDGRNAKPLEDPAVAYERKFGSRADAPALGPTALTVSGGARPSGAAEEASPACPKCGGRMWDNRATKRNPRAPDYKCRDRSCEGVIWPPRPGAAITGGVQAPAHALVAEPEVEQLRGAATGTDDIPF